MHDGEITRLLQRWNAGDGAAFEELMPQVLDDLRRLARSFMAREDSAHTLQPTALVNEVYLRLASRRTVQWANRAHFFTFLGNMMRCILVDHARYRRAAKRGSGQRSPPLDETLRLPNVRDPDLVALDDAMSDLASFDPRLSRIVEMRYFAGLTTKEIAEAESVSPTTVKRAWQVARLWLLQELEAR